MAKGSSSSYLTKRSGDIHKISHDVLHNRYVLYFIFFVTIGNLFLFVSSNDLMSAGVLFTAGVLTSFFSKNMVVIMVTAMVVSNIIRMGMTNRREGFGNDDDEDDDEFRTGDDDDDDEGFETNEGFAKKKKKSSTVAKNCKDDNGDPVVCNGFTDPNAVVDDEEEY
jgi:hypothetical protein